MEQSVLNAYTTRCKWDDKPFCTKACPIGVDVKGMMQAVKEGSFKRAATCISKQTYFPKIISRLCDAPCRGACVRKRVEEALQIGKVERAAATYGQAVRKINRPFRKSGKKIAVVGADLAALTVALSLYEKGHEVTVYSLSDAIGGPECADLNEEERAELLAVKNTAIEFTYGFQMEGEWLYTLAGQYDAVFVSDADKAGITVSPDTDEGIRLCDTSMPKVFAIHRRQGLRIADIGNAKLAAVSLDRFVGRVLLSAGRQHETDRTADIPVSTDQVPAKPAVQAPVYTEEQAAEEAGRCLECACRECAKVCPLIREKIPDLKAAMAGIASDASKLVGIRNKKFLTLGCTNCGLCEKVCPNHIDIGAFIALAKEELSRKEGLSPGIHDFAIRDMYFSNSEACSFYRNPVGKDAANYLFFPGCQMPAVLPEQTAKLYRHLAKRVDIGLFTGCCGAPAKWAGYEADFQKQQAYIAKTWEDAGSPVLVYACSACAKTIKGYLPDAKMVSAWDLLADEDALPTAPGTYTLHDPCTSRDNREIHESVRKLLKKMGAEVREFVYNREHAKCCGYGGLVEFGDPDLSEVIADERIAEAEGDIAVYCAMCRDHFVGRGVNVRHVAELLYGPAEQQPVSYTKRQNNRSAFARIMRETIWGEKLQEEQKMKLIYEEGVEALAQKRMICENDIIQVVEKGESGRKVYHPKTQRFIASKRIGAVTYWVEYKKKDDAFVVCNVYSHRLKIEGTE